MQPAISSEPQDASSEADCVKTYAPLTWYVKLGSISSSLTFFCRALRRSTQEIREAIPANYFERDTAISVHYLCRDLAMLIGLFMLATRIDPWFQLLADQATANASTPTTKFALELGRWATWCV